MDFKKSSLSSSLNSTYTRSENGYGFKRPGLKTGVKYGQDLENRAARAHPKFKVSKRNTLSYINRKLVPILR